MSSIIFRLKKVEISWFWKFKTQFTEKQVRNLDKTQLGVLHGLFSCTFIWVSNVWLLNPGRRYIFIKTPKRGSKYSFLVILRANSRIFKKTQLGVLLTFCPVYLSHKSLLYPKNSGRRYILKKKSVIFVSTFLIERAIRHFWFFLGCKIFVQIYQREVMFGPTICTFATIGHWKSHFCLKMRRPPP